MTADPRGVLYPARLPTFSRMEPPPELTDLVRWFWISQWTIAPGRRSRQVILPHPAMNLVVETELVGLAGPPTRWSHRDLTGRGWAVAALLRPAATPAFTDRPAELRNEYQVLAEPELHAAVRAAMTAADLGAATHAVGAWIQEAAGTPDEAGLLANELAELIAADSTIVRVEQVARAMSISVRTAQRLASRYVGLSPLTMIRRRRLQEAADRVRRDPDAKLVEIAAELGYSDQAHLVKEFRQQLDFTPSSYQREVSQ